LGSAIAGAILLGRFADELTFSKHYAARIATTCTVASDSDVILLIGYLGNAISKAAAAQSCERLMGDAEMESSMDKTKYLTAEEVSERYRGGISVGTLRNWRAMRIGPDFVKIGKAVLYPIEALDAWDQKNTVTCRASNRLAMGSGEEA
jgi:hypothetical protein